MQTAITPVFGDSFEKLKNLIILKNPDAPKYFREAETTPLPQRFFFEVQFRKFYVDDFLIVTMMQFIHKVL